MKLTELEPTLVQLFSVTPEGVPYYQPTKKMHKATGLLLKCPLCHEWQDANPKDVHYVVLWNSTVPMFLVSPEVASTEAGINCRWEFKGKSLEDLTLIGPRIFFPRCKARFYIENGMVHLQ